MIGSVREVGGPVGAARNRGSLSPERDPLEKGLTFPKRERTILLETLEVCFCIYFLPSRLRDLPVSVSKTGDIKMTKFVQSLWNNQAGQDIAEYAVMLAVILVVVVGTIRLVGSNANNVFSSVASTVN